MGFYREIKGKIRNLPLKKAYYLMFVGLIIIPILGVLIAALLILNQQFKTQSIENIRQNQQTVIAEIMGDVENMSMKMSTMVHANNNEIMKYASTQKGAEGSYRDRQELLKIENLYLAPEEDIVSFYFYMKDGTDVYLKSYLKRDRESIENEKWYKSAVENKNVVWVGSYDTKSMDELFTGGNKNMLVLIFALAPDTDVDRSGEIEVVALFQACGAAERIKADNKAYEKGNNTLGITQLVDESGECIYSTMDETMEQADGYLCVKSSFSFYGTEWTVENYVKPGELTKEYWHIAGLVMLVVVAVMALMLYFSRFFIKGIVNPIEDVNQGFLQMEEGNLDVYVEASGQAEVRRMLHQFNAMVRRIKKLIQEYETKMKERAKDSEDYLRELIQGKVTVEEVKQEYNAFWADPYVLIGVYIDFDQNKAGIHGETARLLVNRFNMNSRYASRCRTYIDSERMIYIYYRVLEQDYQRSILSMLQNMTAIVEQEFDLPLYVCVGQKREDYREFEDSLKEINMGQGLRHLVGENKVVDLQSEWGEALHIVEDAAEYSALAEALYIADEKNVLERRDQLFREFREDSLEQIKEEILAVIVAIGNRFEQDRSSLSDIFGQKYDYAKKIMRIEEKKGLRMWVTNFFAWIMEYSETKLQTLEMDMIVKAKRYIQDNYENHALGLSTVAEYVGLNEKYFTNRFTKEAGETFSEYLTGIRVQKAKELLRTTSFKVYEIAEMVGYNNVEHFNRTFKKATGFSPTKYKKAEGM